MAVEFSDDDEVFAPRPTFGQKVKRSVQHVFQRDVVSDKGRVRRRPFRRLLEEDDLDENEALGMAWDRTIMNIDLPEWRNRARAARAMWKLMQPAATDFGDSTRIAVASAKWAEGVDLSDEFLDALEEVLAEEGVEDDEDDEDDGEGSAGVGGLWSMLGWGEEAQNEAELDVEPLEDVPAVEVPEATMASRARAAWEAGKAKLAAAQAYVQNEIDEGKARLDAGTQAAKGLGFGLVAVGIGLVLFASSKQR